MRKSKSEEIISMLWLICTILAFEFGHTMIGYFFAFMTFASAANSIRLSMKEDKGG